jgi:hypothetical protein
MVTKTDSQTVRQLLKNHRFWYQSQCKIDEKSSWRRGLVPRVFGEGAGRRNARNFFEKVQLWGAMLAPVLIKNRENVTPKNIQKLNHTNI